MPEDFSLLTPIGIVKLTIGNVGSTLVHPNHPFRQQLRHLCPLFVKSYSLSSTRCPTSIAPLAGSRSCMPRCLGSATRNLRLVLFHLAREQSRPKSAVFMSTVGESWSMRRFGSGVLLQCEGYQGDDPKMSLEANVTMSFLLTSLQLERADKISGFR